MSRRVRPPRRLVLLAFALPLVVVAIPLVRRALDDRPVYPAAALPAVGTQLPDFRLPTLDGDTLTAARLHGRPVVLALWSLHCGVSQGALAGIDRLRRDYAERGVSVVLLADDGDTTALRRALAAAGVQTPVAYADGRLRRLFDHSRHAPERARYRVRFALPGFLVVDANGQVVHREAGVPLAEFQSRRVQLQRVRDRLDSLVAGQGERHSGVTRSR